MLVGLIVLFGGGWLLSAVLQWLPGDAAAVVLSLLPVAYLAGAVVFAVRPATSRFGAGLLLAVGAALVILAGLCFGLLFMAVSP